MTGGDDILYLITLRNLEIHLVIGLCCFEVCFGTGLLTGLQWYPSPLTYSLDKAISIQLTPFGFYLSHQMGLSG